MSTNKQRQCAEVGSWVKIQENGTSEEEVFRLAQNTILSENALAPDNPMGKALLGAAPGDEVTVHGPTGPINFAVLAVGRDEELE